MVPLALYGSRRQHCAGLSGTRGNRVVYRLLAGSRRFALGVESRERPRFHPGKQYAPSSCRKGLQGMGMEGFAAKWYTSLTSLDDNYIGEIEAQTPRSKPSGSHTC